MAAGRLFSAVTSTPNSTKPRIGGAGGVRSKKGKVGSSSKPRRRKVKLAVRVQYGALPYRLYGERPDDQHRRDLCNGSKWVRV
jgi:hypothetical protein